MLDLYYRWVLKKRFAQTQSDPEQAHEYVLQRLEMLEKHHGLCRLLRWWYDRSSSATAVYAMGIRFPNPIGLAAGFDKNCLAPHALAALGFGSLEIGGVVPKPQPGNARPRVWRDTEKREVTNALGFPSDGKLAVQRRCNKAYPFPIPTGCNLGKNMDTPLEKTAHDMSDVMTALYPCFDWYTINVSSPNTMGLRDLQTEDLLRPLIRKLVQHSRILAERCGVPRIRPIVVKFAPDMSDDELIGSVHCAIAEGVAGIELGNTRRVMLPDGRPAGRSGPSLYPRTLEMIKLIAPITSGKCALVACGGVDAASKVIELLDNGADLVQVFTTLIFHGPGQPARLVKGITPWMQERQHYT